MCPSPEGDDESIVSFSSVSTLGRLLDRLGLDDIASTDSFRLSVRNPRSYGLNEAFTDRLSPSSSRTSKAFLAASVETSKGFLTVSSDTSRGCLTVSADTSRDFSVNSTDILRNLLLTGAGTEFGVGPDSSRPTLFASADLTRWVLSPSPSADNSRGPTLFITTDSDVPSPESRTVNALHLRSINKHREASYQLNIAASPPCNYPRAMYLYATALIMGNGVKQNDALAIRWLSRCILVCDLNQPRSPDDIAIIVDKLSLLSPSDSLKHVMAHLAHYAPPHFEDAHFALDQFLVLPKPQIARMTYASRHQLNVSAVSYYELGLAVISGKGVSKDEQAGMRLLARAALLGYVPAMTELGEMWNAKSRSHKRDVQRAAAWFRCAELFGTTSIGNSWIYKDKYMRKG